MDEDVDDGWNLARSVSDWIIHWGPNDGKIPEGEFAYTGKERFCCPSAFQTVASQLFRREIIAKLPPFDETTATFSTLTGIFPFQKKIYIYIKKITGTRLHRSPSHWISTACSDFSHYFQIQTLFFFFILSRLLILSNILYILYNI